MAKRCIKDPSITWEKLFARGMAIASTSKQVENAVSDAGIWKYFLFKKGKMVCGLAFNGDFDYRTIVVVILRSITQLN